MEIFTLVLQYLLPVLASVLTVVLVALAKKYIVKLGIERSDKIDTMIDKYVGIGVSAAERAGAAWLATNNSALPGTAKKAKAIQVVVEELKQSGIVGVGEELIAARIESWLEDKEELKKTGSENSTTA